MLIFVSDLHLADDRRRSSIDSTALIAAIAECLTTRSLPPGEAVTLVLLGDIFELLKSSVWYKTGVRPWDDPSNDALGKVVRSILQRIADENQEFFEGLNRLAHENSLALQYLPGNHDRVLATDAGASARRLLRQLIPVQGEGDASFEDHFVDVEHGIFAEHGHAFDPINRCGQVSGGFVLGDAVVVEIVERLPIRVATALGIDPFDARLSFIQELDNVRPQDPAGLIRWILYQMDRLPPEGKPEISAALMPALAACINAFLQIADQFRSVDPVLAGLRKLLTAIIERTTVEVLGIVKRLPRALGDELAGVEMRLATLEGLREQEAKIDLFVAGHTHVPLRHASLSSVNSLRIYLNTGTWRRVHLAVERPPNLIGFDSFFEETLLCVNRRDAAHRIRYEFKRQTRGL